MRDPGQQPFLIQLIFRDTFRFLVAGHEAVLLFFVLSGFVLTLPFLKPVQPGYPSYLIKRICRIYLPYLGAVAVAAIGDVLFHNQIPTLGHWFQRMWSEPLSWSILWHHILFIGAYDDGQLNGAFWSLVIEMRVSLIFPLLMLMLRPVRSNRAMRFTAVAAVLLGALPFGSPLPYVLVAFSTLHYAMAFIVGSLVARSLKECSKIYLSLSGLLKKTLWLMILLAFSFSTILTSRPLLVSVSDMILTMASACLIVIAAADPNVRTWLQRRTPQFLGKISYSLYLVHVPVLLALVHSLYSVIPLAAILPIYLVLAFSFAYLFHRAVEVPSMQLGSRLSRNIEGRQGACTVKIP
jgi:peptidoglycan/LPS O-acetylase OafA/YrhL